MPAPRRDEGQPGSPATRAGDVPGGERRAFRITGARGRWAVSELCERTALVVRAALFRPEHQSPRRMRRNRAIPQRGRAGAGVVVAWRVGDPSRAPALAGAQPRGDRLVALELVRGLGRCEPDSRAVGDGRATGMERSADVEPKGRRRRRVGDQPRRPQPRSRSETARFSARGDPRRQGRRALRPPTGRSRRTVGGTVARSGMEGGRAAPSAGELSRTRRRSALADGDQREAQIAKRTE